MSPIRMKQEVEKLEQWFREFKEPVVPPGMPERIKAAVHSELVPHEGEVDTQRMVRIREDLKKVVHQELALLRQRRAAQWTHRLGSWLSAAAVIGFGVFLLSSFSNSRNNVSFEAFELLQADSSTIDGIESDLELLESRSSAWDQLFTGREDEFGSLQEQLEQLILPGEEESLTDI